jgi:CRISPR/Cas system-associated exonuclease Cas4 (RecB family)
LKTVLRPSSALSQSSLQDFKDCARRFQLRYVMDQRWPAPPAEPLHDVERADLVGKQFHRVMERHWLGLPIQHDGLEPELQGWWDAFVANPVQNLPGTVRRPEVHTTAQSAGQRVVATFDLLAYEPGGQAAIVDWKTSQRKPTRNILDRRLQTSVYPLLLVESSQRLLGFKLAPDDVRLIYWFANAPAEVEVFQYSTARYETDKKTLETMTERLLSLDTNAIWPLTPNVELCRFCQYRSLCDRGREAGDFREEHDEEVAEPEIVLETPTPDDFVL